MNVRHLLGPAALAAACLLPAACSSQAKEATSQQAEAVPVVIGTVAQREVPVELLVIGTVEAYSTVGVKAQVGGELTGVHFEEGQEVRKGELLFDIDNRTYAAALKEAEATLARDRVQSANAQDVVRRYTDLVKKEYVTQEGYERISSEAAALEATVHADEARVDNARIQLEYCTIHSPVAGRTGKLMVHRGNLVKANADTPLVTINQIDPVYVAFSVPEQDLPEVKRRWASGSLVTQASAPQSERTPMTGELSFVDNQVDADTRTILLKSTFSNKDRLLWPGQFVNVRLRLSTDPDALVVPSETIQTGQQGSYVFVVKPDQTVEMRPVVAGRTDGSDTVVDKGLQKGETVVTDGQLRIVPGAKVQAKAGVGGGGDRP
jgi:multidrug efflux system membrane fusion protein